MSDLRAQIIDWVEEDRDVFLNFLGEFVRANRRKGFQVRRSATTSFQRAKK